MRTDRVGDGVRVTVRADLLHRRAAADCARSRTSIAAVAGGHRGEELGRQVVGFGVVTSAPWSRTSCAAWSAASRRPRHRRLDQRGALLVRRGQVRQPGDVTGVDEVRTCCTSASTCCARTSA
jgi:hypothetical protein